MDVMNCKTCGRICRKSQMGLCLDCLDKLGEYEKIICDYVRKHKDCSVDEIQKNTPVPFKVIMDLIKTGRLMPGTVGYTCEKCGTIIYRNRLCDKCALDIKDELGRILEQKTTEKSPERKHINVYPFHRD